MYEYISGTISNITSNYIVLDNNGIGYLIYVSNPYSFKENKEEKVYVYQQVREDENSLFGFHSLEEKELFLRLINVKGLGCRMALPMLSASINDIMDAIEHEDIRYLKKFPKIGDKVARQIILDLKGKLDLSNKGDKGEFDELIEVLEGLGYKKADINKILPNISSSISIESQIKEALKLLAK